MYYKKHNRLSVFFMEKFQFCFGKKINIWWNARVKWVFLFGCCLYIVRCKMWVFFRARAICNITRTHLASVGLYVTSYFSTCSTWLVLQDTRTDVGFRNITVMFSGTPGMPVTEPTNKTEYPSIFGYYQLLKMPDAANCCQFFL